MSVSITAILAIEDSLANRLNKTWKRIVAEMVAVAMPYVERKEWDKAYKLADRLDMAPVFDLNREYIKYCTYSSMLFGASRLRRDLKNSAVANKSWGWFIDDVLQGLRVQIVDNVGKQAREAYFAEIGRLEEEAKQAQLSSVLKYDENQPRDSRGRWTDTLDLMGEKDFYKAKGLHEPEGSYDDNKEGWSDYFKKERPLKQQWTDMMDRAISTGEITEEEARSKYGFYSNARNYGGYKDLPETMWHVTTALSKIQEQGFKTRDETGRSGLGGGTSDTISFTDNVEMARGYLEAMKLSRSFMKGDISPQDLMLEAKRDGYWNDILDTMRRESSGERNGLPTKIADLMEGGTYLSMPVPEHLKDAPQARLDSILGMMGSRDFKGARREGDFLYRDLDKKNAQELRAQFLKYWLFWREQRTRKVDPVFFTNNWDDLINTPESDIALVEVKSKPKARGYYLPAEHEFRIRFGDLVDLKRVVAKVEKSEEQRLLKPFQTFAKEGRGLLQLVSQLHTSRLSAFGFCAEAEVMEVQDYQITEQLDNRVCPVCVLEGERVAFDPSKTTAVSKRPYKGEAVSLKLADGKQLSVTPNHPVLTSRGWVAASSLVEGDSIVSCVGAQWETSDRPNDVYRQTKVEEVFKAFSLLFGTGREVPVSSEDFHGDGGTESIAVVLSKGVLRADLDPALLEKGNELKFIGGLLAELCLPAFRHELGDLNGPGPARQQCVSLFDHAGVEAAASDASFLEKIVERIPVDPRGALDFLHRNFGEVEFNRLVEKRIFMFEGHVYNLSTDENFYVAQGIVVHNCEIMHGKKFKVSDARNALLPILKEKNPDNLRSMQPWPKQTKANLARMEKMSAQDFIDANWHIPPYHPWCRGLLVPVGKAPKLKPVIEAQQEQVINAPTAQEVQATFEELNLSTTPELAQAWTTTVAKPPVLFLAEVLGKKMTDLTKTMMEVERQSKLSAIGITGFQWDKQYIKLAGRELFDEKVPWSLKLDFYDRRWELTRLMSEDPEFRALVMQHWGPYFDELGLMYEG